MAPVPSSLAGLVTTTVAALVVRDDPKPESPRQKLLAKILLPVILVACVSLLGVYQSYQYFRNGGSLRNYLKAWGKAIFYITICIVFFPVFLFFLVREFLPQKYRTKQQPATRQQGRRPQPQPQPQPQQQRSTAEPPPLERPTMPLDPVTVVPDAPEMSDPDAVQMPAPVLLRSEKVAGDDGDGGDDENNENDANPFLKKYMDA
ncbi:hypothetical protein SPI_02307 [Niveomyces insectorum RCEF 264]|uniref:Transmembrane protein n=1 Tax=Niveomyces insectorum RCEF 264 TaxID=1081102 RepID=A0A162MR34_9HYPO|nr:hypothetical protein SPI_02307 [Niveomyces insectorum RCEF 264]